MKLLLLFVPALLSAQQPPPFDDTKFPTEASPVDKVSGVKYLQASKEDVDAVRQISKERDKLGRDYEKSIFHECEPCRLASAELNKSLQDDADPKDRVAAKAKFKVAVQNCPSCQAHLKEIDDKTTELQAKHESLRAKLGCPELDLRILGCKDPKQPVLTVKPLPVVK